MLKPANAPERPLPMMNTFEELLRSTKLRLLKMHHEANAGHLGGNLSCIDALMTLHHRVMREEDRFVLSKGHSAGALYATLWSKGKLSDNDLASFTQDDTLLPGHPSGSGIPGLLFSTGSLGHGPSLSAGLALAARHRRQSHRIFCLCSDGEWQEGGCWEALTFAVHQRLDNLVILIDQNGLQGFGRTSDVISCEDLGPRISAFGATVRMVDGHDPSAIATALTQPSPGSPLILVLRTIKGRGLHNEDRLESHYLPLTAAQYSAAKEKIQQEDAK